MSHDEIQANNARFCAALATHDMESLLATYDEETTVLIPGMPPIHGRAAVGDYYVNVFDAGVTAATMRTHSLEEVGDTFVEVGEYSMTVAPPGVAAFTDVGKYLVIHRPQPGGGWAMWMDMFHSDSPAPVA